MGQLQLDDDEAHMSPADCTQSAAVKHVPLPYGIGGMHMVLLNQMPPPF